MSPENLGNVLGALATLFSDQMSAAVSSTGLQLAEATALSLLTTYPECSIEELRAPLGLSHSGGVRLVDRLAAAGHVERRVGGDARSVALRLTRRGREAAAAAMAQRAEVLARAVHMLSREEQRVLGQLASKILEQAAPLPQMAEKTCRLCDHDACVVCPFAGFGDSRL
jgi:DNA-binding MarR family transcriptional regulator